MLKDKRPCRNPKCKKKYRPWNKHQMYCSIPCGHAMWPGGNSGSFKKGIIVWNKGKKGMHVSRATEFKKGHRPAGWHPVGTIVTRTVYPNARRRHHGRRRWIKIKEPNKWQEYGRYLWTKHRGRIPKGMLVRYKDGDGLHDYIRNLQLVTRAQSINLNRDMLQAFRKDIASESVKQEFDKAAKVI